MKTAKYNANTYGPMSGSMGEAPVTITMPAQTARYLHKYLKNAPSGEGLFPVFQLLDDLLT